MVARARPKVQRCGRPRSGKCGGDATGFLGPLRVAIGRGVAAGTVVVMDRSEPRSQGPRLTTLRLPIDWGRFGLPSPLAAGPTVLTDGDVGWAWDGAVPDLGIGPCEPATGTSVEGWSIDHVVLLVPALGEAIDTLAASAIAPRLRMEVRGRPTAFFRVGPVLEVIESPVRAPAVFGVALVTTEPLEVVVLRWRALDLDVDDPRPALQPGRRITTVRGLDAGLAVMSPDRAVGPS